MFPTFIVVTTRVIPAVPSINAEQKSVIEFQVSDSLSEAENTWSRINRKAPQSVSK